MNIENLDAVSCEEIQPRRKNVAIITGGLAHTLRAEMLSHFSCELVERGWGITIITNNRQGFFDFLVDDRIQRYSMDTSFHPKEKRQVMLQEFVQNHPEIDQYLFWDARMKTFCDDFDTIQQLNKPAFIVFWDSLNELGKYGANDKKKIMSRIAASAGTISSFPLDHVISNTVFIPYLFPYQMGDLSTVKLGKKNLLLLTAGSSSRVFAVVENFVKLLESDENFKDKTLRIVPIDKKLKGADEKALAEIAAQYPKNIFLEDLCEKPHKVLDGSAGAILVDNGREYPKILSITVAKGLPTLFVKGYADYSIQNFNKGFRICHSNNSVKMQDELRRFFDPKVNAKRAAATRRAVGRPIKDQLMDRWENVLLGKPVEEYEFVSQEHVLMCSLSYMKNLNQRLVMNYGKAAHYNSDPIVKKAKAKVAALSKKGTSYPFTRFKRWLDKLIAKWAEAYHRWERNKFLWRSYIDTDMATRKKVQMLILKIYIEFERICKENGYRFYIAGGTLLGAVRHKGFIPWDDDLDVVMPRKDYDAFLKHCSSQLREGFVLNAHAYPYTFTRLEVLGPRTTAPLQRNGRNIFVDILPLDCAAVGKARKERHGARSDKLRKAMMDEAKQLFPIKWENRKAIFIRLLRKIFCPYPLMIKKWTRNARKYQSDNATHWVCLPGDYGYDGESFPVEYWGEPVMMEFEGLSVPAMSQWDTYLSEHYGDYMQYPPVSQRSLKHKIFSIDFERYEKMTVEEIAKEVSDDYFASTGKRVDFLK